MVCDRTILFVNITFTMIAFLCHWETEKLEIVMCSNLDISKNHPKYSECVENMEKLTSERIVLRSTIAQFVTAPEQTLEKVVNKVKSSHEKATTFCGNEFKDRENCVDVIQELILLQNIDISHLLMAVRRREALHNLTNVFSYGNHVSKVADKVCTNVNSHNNEECLHQVQYYIFSGLSSENLLIEVSKKNNTMTDVVKVFTFSRRYATEFCYRIYCNIPECDWYNQVIFVSTLDLENLSTFFMKIKKWSVIKNLSTDEKKKCCQNVYLGNKGNCLNLVLPNMETDVEKLNKFL